MNWPQTDDFTDFADLSAICMSAFSYFSKINKSKTNKFRAWQAPLHHLLKNKLTADPLT